VGGGREVITILKLRTTVGYLFECPLDLRTVMLKCAYIYIYICLCVADTLV